MELQRASSPIITSLEPLHRNSTGNKANLEQEQEQFEIDETDATDALSSNSVWFLIDNVSLQKIPTVCQAGERRSAGRTFTVTRGYLEHPYLLGV